MTTIQQTITCAGLILVLLVSACGTGTTSVRFPSVDQEAGFASYYAPEFHGSRTASGEIYRNDALTAAHPTLPFGSMVKVTNVRNGSSVQVRINDRGPFVRGRILDLSLAAAQKLGMVDSGLARVRIVVVDE